MNVQESKNTTNLKQNLKLLSSLQLVLLIQKNFQRSVLLTILGNANNKRVDYKLNYSQINAKLNLRTFYSKTFSLANTVIRSISAHVHDRVFLFVTFPFFEPTWWNHIKRKLAERGFGVPSMHYLNSWVRYSVSLPITRFSVKWFDQPIWKSDEIKSM